MWEIVHLVGFHYKNVLLVPTIKQVVEAHIFCSYFVRTILILSFYIIILFQKVSFLHVFLPLLSTHFASPNAYHIPCPPLTFFLLYHSTIAFGDQCQATNSSLCYFLHPCIIPSSQFTIYSPAPLPQNTQRSFPGARPSFSSTKLLTSWRISKSYHTSTTFSLV